MVVVVGIGLTDLLTGALVAACLTVILGCCSLGQARDSVDWSLLVVIAAALGIGQAVTMSGLSSTVANSIVTLAGGNPWLVLLAVYFSTAIFTELITNNAAAVLMFSDSVLDGDGTGRRRDAVCHLRLRRSIGRICHAVCVSDQSDGVRPRRIPVFRLPADRHPVVAVDYDRDGRADAVYLEILGSGQRP